MVQGGWYFGGSSLVDEDVLAEIREVAPLAPLHNNPEANVIESWPGAVFRPAERYGL